ncbi:MAG: agmatinase [Desulfobulbaceae bacterium]|nr:agmatinase [Desulfobulbaceae bacterium]
MTTQLLFHGDDVNPTPPDMALFHVIPVPYEKTVSYEGGTMDGPKTIMEASCQLELFDGKSIPARHGIHTFADVDCSGSAEDVMLRIKDAVADCLALNKIPVVLGGEHTVTVGIVDGLLEKYDEFGVIQFDAHADLRHSYQGTLFSHACVMKRIFDHRIPFYQLGTRSYSHEEHLLRLENKTPYLDAETIHKHGVDAFSLPPDFPDKVFVTFDIDGLDPSIMPATGTPVPGGLTWYQAMWLIEKIMESRVCIGFDVVEFAPIPGFHSASFTVAQLVYNMMGYLTRSEVNMDYFGLDEGFL